MGFDHASGRAAYFLVGNTLRRLTWNASGSKATLEPASYTFSTAGKLGKGAMGISDASAFYFPDGKNLFAVSGDGAPQLLATAEKPILSVYLAGNSLALWEVDQSVSPTALSVSMVPKSGGTPLVITGVGQAPTLLGASSNYVIYLVGNSIRAYAADGSADTPIIRALAAPYSYAEARSGLPRAWPISSVTYCIPDPGTDNRCRNGQIMEVDANTLQSRVQGSISHSMAYPNGGLSSLRGQFRGNFRFEVEVIAQVATFTDHSVNGNVTVTKDDFYMYTPGVANSFVQLTHNFP